MNKLGTAIREARVRRGIVQVELAERLGVVQAAVSFWENGVDTPSFKNLVKLTLEFPELTEVFEAHAADMLERLRRLEREASGGRCHCSNCTCHLEAATS
jgi:transcriptional regulator with XRE-family HTH domain